MTTKACVIGFPIAHSRSPLIHRHWLAELGIDGSYDRVEVAPDRVETFLGSLGAQGFAGANVTIPHKEAAFRLARIEDPVALALEAANLVWIGEGGVLRGANTDVAGFLANLDECKPGWDGSLDKVVVLGAGGAARAAIHALASRGAGEIVILNRSVDRAEALGARIEGAVTALPLGEAPRAMAGASLLVNATSLGMKGQPALDLDLSGLPREALVTDLVYVPLETGLLRQARERGNPTVDGLGMLLHQAVPAFETWFGKRPTVTPELRALVIRDLGGDGR
jgi:shikimate dehydrogenase